jgi:hypothetical protein
LFHAKVLAADHRVEEMLVGDVDAKRAAAALAASARKRTRRSAR